MARESQVSSWEQTSVHWTVYFNKGNAEEEATSHLWSKNTKQCAQNSHIFQCWCHSKSVFQVCPKTIIRKRSVCKHICLILILKHARGILGKVLEWFKLYLQHRSASVMILFFYSVLWCTARLRPRKLFISIICASTGLCLENSTSIIIAMLSTRSRTSSRNQARIFSIQLRRVSTRRSFSSGVAYSLGPAFKSDKKSGCFLTLC